MKKILHGGYIVVALFYTYLLLHTVFFGRDARRSVNLEPFQMISEQGLSLNVYGNIIMFIPLGIYVANHFKSLRFWQALAAVIGASVTIEIVQFLAARGATDIDDVLLNTAGGCIGIAVYYGCRLRWKAQTHTAICVLSLVVGLPIMALTCIIWLANM